MISPRAIRYALISVHYRQKLNFTFEGIQAATSALKRVDEMRLRLKHAVEGGEEREKIQSRVSTFLEQFREGLADDLNVSFSLGGLFDFVRDVNRSIEDQELGAGDIGRIEDALKAADAVLGVLDMPWGLAGEGAAAGPRVISAGERAGKGRSARTETRL